MNEEHVAPSRATSVRRIQSTKDPVAVSVLESEAGSEWFFTAESPPDLDLAASWRTLQSNYNQALRERGLEPDTEVFVRLHVSDPLNQIAYLRDSMRQREGGLVSIVGQRPLPCSRIALEAYHLSGRRRPCRRQFHPKGHLVVDHSSYTMLWATLCSRQGSAGAQTTQLLSQLEQLASSHDATIQNNLQRTWFFVRDIDRNYSELVDARRIVFERWGMTASTHYVSSTGIAGELRHCDELVALDALLECGLAPEQVHFMTAETDLCPTRHYGVTFERGTRTTYGDRTHYHISGTASIDKDGQIVHEGNLDRQIERTLENIEALLSRQGARLSDLKQAVVYLRDASDGRRAQALLTALLPRATPFVMVEGRVCRPEWLIEIEGIAGVAIGDSRFADYF